MTSYLAHHTKKKKILARKEAALKRLLAGDVPEDKLIAAAVAVREARIRVLRVQRSLIVPKGNHAEVYLKIDLEIERLSKVSPESLLREFNWSR